MQICELRCNLSDFIILDTQDISAGHTPCRPAGPEVTDITQLMELVAFGKCIAFLPASAAELLPRDDVVHIPVDDLSDSRLVVAWSSSSRSQAVACFVRAATDVARTSPLALASLG